MAKKYGQEKKLTGFTRGGVPVGRRTGAKSSGKAPGTKTGRNWGVGEYVALGAAGVLTGAVGATAVAAGIEGYRGGPSKFNKTR